MKSIYGAAAVLMLSATTAFAQLTVSTEKTKTDADGTVKHSEKSTTIDSGAVAPVNSTSVRTETTQQSTVSAPETVSYTTRLEQAYRSAGVPDTEIVKLRDIDMKVLEARKMKHKDKIKEYYTEQTRILKPEQVTKVRSYLVEHPVPANQVITTYEEVPATTGVSVNTPLGSVGVGVNAGTRVIEKKEVVPAPPQ